MRDARLLCAAAGAALVLVALARSRMPPSALDVRPASAAAPRASAALAPSLAELRLEGCDRLFIDGGALPPVRAYVEGVEWTHGPKTLHSYDDGSSLGIRGMWINGKSATQPASLSTSMWNNALSLTLSPVCVTPSQRLVLTLPTMST